MAYNRKKTAYRHWVSTKPTNQRFPFAYDLFKIDEVLNNEDYIVVDYYNGDNLKNKMRLELIKQFPYFDYLDEDNYNKIKLKNYKKIFRVNVKQGNKNEKGKIIYVTSESQYVEAKNFSSDYRYTLIKSLEHLKTILVGAKVLGFDTETTGLNPDKVDKIVGVSFAKEPFKSYYIPIAHSVIFDEMNLGMEAVKIFYEAMVKAERVFMFNSRFDMRMMEYSECLFDMSKVKFMDTQINCYFADPGYPNHSLKHLESLFLGYYRPDLGDLLKHNNIDGFSVELLNPKNILFYAGQDAMSTLEMGYDTLKYYEEFGISGQIDQMILYKLMKMENVFLDIDIPYLEGELAVIMPRLKELDDKIRAEIGDVNLNSPKQKVKLFKSFGLDTHRKTKTGNMATGKEHIVALIERLEKAGKKYPKWLGLLNERAKLDKLQSSFFNSLLEQAKMYDGKVRINYRHGNTSTGRFSSGEEKDE